MYGELIDKLTNDNHAISNNKIFNTSKYELLTIFYNNSLIFKD